MSLLLILSLLCAQPYLISQGKYDKQAWTLAYKFSLDLPGKFLVSTNAKDYLLLNSKGSILLSCSGREIYLREGKYLFLVKGPASWKLYFSPCPPGPAKKPMEKKECERWVKKQSLIGPGKEYMKDFYSIGVFTLADVEARALAVVSEKPYPWMDWLKDDKLKQVPPFRPGEEPRDAHFIYRLALQMLHSPEGRKGLFCIPRSFPEPSLSGIYRYLGWDGVDLKDFNAIGVRLRAYLILRQKGFSPDDAFTRADSQARVIFSSPFKPAPELKKVFELIYRRFFQ